LRVNKVRAATAVAAVVSAALVGTVDPAAAAGVTVAYWHMEEATGATKMVDSSGNGNTGTISSGVKLAQAGYSGRGYTFPGKGLVTVPSSSSLNPGSSPYSAALRFKSTTKPSSSVGDYDLIRKGLSTTSGGDWKMEVLQNGTVFCHFRGSSRSVDLTGTTNVVNGSWHLLECRTTSTGGVQLRVDGTAQASSSRSPGTISNSASLTVGAKNSTEDLTTGSLDEVRITKG
jgi:predicted acyltransferase